MTYLSEKIRFDEHNWREVILLFTVLSSLSGILILLINSQFFGFNIDLFRLATLIGIPSATLILLLLWFGKTYAAVWCFLLTSWLAEIIHAFQQSDPNHINTLSIAIFSIVIISVVGTPFQTFLIGLFNIGTNLLLTGYFIESVSSSNPPITWIESWITVNIYLALLLPLVAISWIINRVFQRLQTNNEALTHEIMRRIEAEKNQEIYQNSLKRQVSWFRKVIDGSPDIFVVFNDQGELIDVNEVGLRKLGYTREEIMGISIAQLDADWSPQRLQAQAEAMQQQNNHNTFVRGRNRRKDGSIFPVEVASSLIMDGDEERRVGFIRDISDRLEAEQAIRESEKRYRALYNRSPVMMHSIDANGTIIDVNDYWTRIMNYSREEVLNTPIDRYFTSESMRKALDIDIPAYFSTGHAENLPYQMVKKEGEIIDVSFSTINQYDEDGQFSHTQSTIVDVTSEKELATALQESEKKFRAVFNNTFSFIGLLERDGTLIEANQSAYTFGNLKPEDVLNKPFWEASWWQHSATVQAELQAAIQTAVAGHFVRYEVDVQAGDGHLETIDFSIKPIFDADEQVTLLVPEGRVITNLKKVENELVQSEKRFRALFNDSSDFTLALSADGVVQDANDRIEIATILGRVGFLNRYIWDAAPFENFRETGETLHEMYTELIQTKASARREVAMATRILGQLYLDIIMTPIYDHMENLEIIIVEARDITQLVQTREALRQTAEDNKVLLREVHHRVKNNLQIIISMLRSQIRATPSEHQKVSFREMMSRVQSMSLLHQQLYQRNSDLDEIDLDRYLSQLLKEIQRTHNIPIDLHIEVSSVWLNIDRALTCGLIVNELATNALKYAFPNRVGTLRVSGYKKNGQIHLEIADDGIGLPPEIEIETATTTGFQLINLMRQQLAGTIVIDRTKGTCVKLSFPSDN